MVGKGEWMMAIFVYMMGVIGFSGSNIFYDSLLPSVADESKVDSVSSLGFAMGYLGGGLLFLLNVVMTLQPAIFGLADASEAVRWSFVSVAFWWGAFTFITIAWVPEPEIGNNKRQGSLVSDGFNQLYRTFQEIRHLKTVLLFLLSYWFYIDGVDTIIKMAVDYGISIGFESNDLIIALLIVQFVGFPAALIFGRLGERWGVRPSIFLAIVVYIAVTIWGTMMREKYEFYVLAIVIGLVQGGIQALSRSYYSRLIPKNQAAEYYGFYNMLGKFAAIIGPALMAVVGLTMRNVLMPESPTAEQLIEVGQDASRWSIASIIVLFVIGGTLLFFVDEEKGRAEADYLSQN
jgi:UMF1 family MFS transporter